MNGYKCFYRGNSLDVYADTALQAVRRAAEHFKDERTWEVHCVLCEQNDALVSVSSHVGSVI